VKQFPDSERTVSTFRYIKRAHLQHSIIELQRSIENNPDPAAYARLAILYYKDLGDWEAALEVCRRGIVMFPDAEELHLINGQIRFHRFHESYLAKDGLKAVEHLSKAAQINPRNYKAQQLLARLLTEARCFRKAQEVLECILSFMHDDELSRSLLAKLQQLEPEKDEDVERMFKRVERAGAIAKDIKELVKLYEPEEVGEPATPQGISPHTVRELLPDLLGVAGCEAAVVIDTDGTLQAAQSNSGLDPQTLAQAALTIHRTAAESAQRMDIGSFNRCLIDGPRGAIHMVETRNLVLMVLASPAARKEAIERAIDNFLDQLVARTMVQAQ
jgi:predicted regulator of Ras-like GTPase activity (Roadblock/LC7/MglB family)